MMTAKTLADLLDGGNEKAFPPAELIKQAKEAGLVIVFGYSDDGVCFDGAIKDQIGAYDGTTAYLTGTGIFEWVCSGDCPHEKLMLEKCIPLEVLSDFSGGAEYCWKYKTDIPHEKFILNNYDDEPWCEGIVFSMDDLKATFEKRNQVNENPLCKPIARGGEPVYASIVRNRSGVDAGDIDYGCRVFDIEKLCEGDKQDIVDTAYALYERICYYAGKRAKLDPSAVETSRWMPKAVLPTFEQANRCNNEFRTFNFDSDVIVPVIRYYDDTDGTWSVYSTNSDSLPTLVPNDSFTHWLDETFPAVEK